MKKLGKLSINPEKVMNFEELVNIKGGDELYYTHLNCGGVDVWGYGYASSCAEAYMRAHEQQPYCTVLEIEGC